MRKLSCKCGKPSHQENQVEVEVEVKVAQATVKAVKVAHHPNTLCNHSPSLSPRW